MLRAVSRSCLLLLATAVPAQGLQSTQVQTVPEIQSTLVWDSHRGRLLAVGYRNVWQWDGTTWAPCLGTTIPAFGSAVFDTRRNLVLLGTTNGIGEWDGGAWTMRYSSMQVGFDAFDSQRGRAISVQGSNVLEWDGVQWLTFSPAYNPGARSGAAIAYDDAHHRCLLYGGSLLSTGIVGDCWSWDGTAWTQLAANAPPGTRLGATLAYEPPTGRMILRGGDGSLATTWAFDGTTWTRILSVQDPGPRDFARMAWDGTGIVLWGGSATHGTEVWRFANNAWQEVPGGAPTPRYAAATAFDPTRGELVLLGGRDSTNYMRETWTFDGAWHHHPNAVFPGWLLPGRCAWSSAEQMVLTWDGTTTWTWNGSDWIDRTPAHQPPPRTNYGLATDAAAGVLLFGGQGSQPSPLGDQWHWDGTDWSLQTPALAPSPRALPLMAFDPLRARVVLVSGQQSTTPLADTWEWDGAAWTQAAAAPFLSASASDGFAYRPETGRMHVSRGTQAFEWDGTTWTMLAVTPNVLTNDTLVTDSVHQRLLCWAQPPTDLMTFTPHPGSVTRYGVGCAIGPAPALSTRGSPTPGNGAFALVATTHAPGALCAIQLGLSRQNTPLGSGCTLLVGSVLATHLFTANATGDVVLPFAIPPAPTLRGVRFTAQCAVVDPAHSAFAGVTVSAGLETVIGDGT